MPEIVIAIDAMGGDVGPTVTVPAAVEFLREDKHVDIQRRVILVGDTAKIERVLPTAAQALVKSGSIEIHHATEVVEMDEAPAKALKRKKDSSMRVAINLVKEGKAQAAVSAGNTGALMATARFVLKTIKGISRPAIISTMPCNESDKVIHMLDLGANVDSSPEMLEQFAVLGSALSEHARGLARPKVALLNVGAEDIKGSEKVKSSAQLLCESALNYVGYVESDEIFSGRVDVIVCDGFEGNVALKATEGTAKTIFSTLRQEFRRSLVTKIMALIAKPVLRAVQNRLDPRRHNGATLIGLNGVVVKSHGGTDGLGFLHAIEEAAVQVESSFVTTVATKVEEYYSYKTNR